MIQSDKTGGRVSRILFRPQGGRLRSFSWDRRHHRPQAAYPRVPLPKQHRAGPTLLSYLALLQVGFNQPRCHHHAGALLPHLFTLTCAAKAAIGGVVSVPLSVGLPRLAVSKHFALWSSDFPLTDRIRPPATARSSRADRLQTPRIALAGKGFPTQTLLRF